MSTRTDILNHLQTYLVGATTAKVYLRRTSDVNPSQLPCVLIIPDRSPVRVAAGRVQEHLLNVNIVTMTEGATAVADAEAIAALLMTAIASNKTMGSHATDTTLNDISEEREQTDKLRAAVAFNIQIRYETALWAF